VSGAGIEGLDHVQLAMPAGGEEDARGFYAGVLGLTEVEKPAGMRAAGGCWFAGPGVQVHLGATDDFHPALKAHPGFRVVDVEAAAATLEAAGYPVRPDDRLPGVRRFHSEDCFGNRLEFLSAADLDR
jgi:catechol 2,3-dioxygenase-like lactoylglutathione lyase family enzyme